MSRASKVAIASAAAGVLAATAAGLANTRKGRQVTRQIGKQVRPAINARMTAVIDTVEATLAEHGLLQMIPARVRANIHARLAGMASGQRTSTRRSPPRRRATARARRTTGGKAA